MLFGLRVFYDNSNAIVSFVCSRNTATALCVEMWATPHTINDWSIANLFYYANSSGAG